MLDEQEFFAQAVIVRDGCLGWAGSWEQPRRGDMVGAGKVLAQALELLVDREEELKHARNGQQHAMDLARLAQQQVATLQQQLAFETALTDEADGQVAALKDELSAARRDLAALQAELDRHNIELP